MTEVLGCQLSRSASLQFFAPLNSRWAEVSTKKSVGLYTAELAEDGPREREAIGGASGRSGHLAFGTAS